jgi:hypothetical protein
MEYKYGLDTELKLLINIVAVLGDDFDLIVTSNILEDKVISFQEERLLNDLRMYQPDFQTSIILAGLIDENYSEKYPPKEILGKLSSPIIVVFYLKNFYKFGGSGPVIYLPAVDAIKNKQGRCIDYAQIGATALSDHGYEAYNMGVHITTPYGHNVTAFRDKDEKIYVITNGTGVGDQQGAVLLGPYESWVEAGYDMITKGYIRKGTGDIRLLNPYTVTRPRGDILDLPWKIIGR